MSYRFEEAFYDRAIEALQKLVRIKSVEEKNDGPHPFGEGPYEALMCILGEAEALGFETHNHKNICGHVELKGESDDYIGVVGHMDVVPEGDPADWIHPPYGAEIHDGKMFGRGTLDDKGPMVASLYALKAIKDSGIKLKRTVRLIAGTNEETGSLGVKSYFETFPAPHAGFTPDSDFPCIHAEYGILKNTFSTPIHEDILELSGGSAHNMVADRAKIRLRADEKLANSLSEIADAIEKPEIVKIRHDYADGVFELSVIGKSAHGSIPSTGENAIDYMMDILSRTDEEKFDFARDYMRLFGYCHDGEKMGIRLHDEESGTLRLNKGVLTLKDHVAKLIVNIRYPVTFTAKEPIEGMKKASKDTVWEMSEEYSDAEPLFFPVDHPLVATLTEVYRKNTGDDKTAPIETAGGTYARETSNIIAFGPGFPGDEEVIHKPNEWIAVDHFKKLIDIYYDAILELAKK